MENNETITFSTTCSVQGEKATMITESKIELLESLAKRVGKFEKTAPQWDKFKMGLSASATWTLFAIGNIISFAIDDYNKLKTPTAFLLYLFIVVGIIGIILCWYMCNKEKELKINIYDSHIDEITEILQKLKKQLNQT